MIAFVGEKNLEIMEESKLNNKNFQAVRIPLLYAQLPSGRFL